MRKEIIVINSVNIRRLIKNRIFCFSLAVLLIAQVCGCGAYKVSNEADSPKEVVITLFAAKSLNVALDEINDIYKIKNPNVKVQTNYDSSGTLVMQIVEGGGACDVFFSASPKQVDTLEEKGLIIQGTRNDLLRNQMCVVTGTGSKTEVTGLTDMHKAKSLAIAGQSVPIGSYTRTALRNLGILEEKSEGAEITSKDISEALGNVTINECANVGAVVSAIAEHSNEVGTVYYSDIAGHEDSIQILEMVSTDITGEIIYPVVQVQNKEANEIQRRAAAAFIEFLESDEAKEVFEKYYFITE